MANPRLSIIPLLRSWNPTTKTVQLDVVVLPDGDPRQPLSDGWPTAIPPSAPFEGAALTLRSGRSADVGSIPTRADLALPADLLLLAVPAEQSAVLDELATRFNIVLPAAPLARSSATRLGKYLPQSYRGAFPFVAPKTALAFTDDTYHCALRCPPSTAPVPARPPGDVSWGEALAFALRHPLLARALGLVHTVAVPVGDDFAAGGWLALMLDDTSLFTAQTAADGDFARTYLTRVPALEPGASRTLFTPTVFPLAVDAPGLAAFGDFDEALREAIAYDDGFCRIVHASQPRTRDPIAEDDDSSPPLLDVGIALGWDDEDVLIAQNRAIGVEPDGSPPAPAPQVVSGYRVDVSTPDDPTWRSLCQIHSPGVTLGPVALGDLDWEQPVEVHPRRVDGRFFLPIMFAHWRGRSLVSSTREDRLLTGVPEEFGSAEAPVGLENFRLRWGGDYRFRVRLTDFAGGGPDVASSPDTPSASGVAEARFLRYVAPGLPLVTAVGIASAPTEFSVSRPRLGYPEATFTSIPDAREQLVSQMEAALTTGTQHRPELPDPDAVALEFEVRVRMPAFDPTADPDGYVRIGTGHRSFPADPAQPLQLSLEFVDCARLDDRGWEASAFPGAAAGPIAVPSNREVRVRVRVVARDDPGYMGSDAARRSPWHDLTAEPYRQPATAEPPVFGPRDAVDALASAYLRHDAATASTSDAPVQNRPSGVLSARLASAAGLLEDDGTLLNEPGQRVVFACAGLKHHLPPDRSAIALTAIGELADRWLNVLRVPIDRDWSWQGLDAPAFVVTRTIRPIDAPGDPVLNADAIEISYHHSVNTQAVRGEVDRSRLELVVLDAFAPVLVDGLPYEAEVTYEITARLVGGATETASVTNRLPITTPPTQLPEVVSVGHAFSDYEHGEHYQSTTARTRRLWIEFAKPPADPRDSYFVRVVTSAPDPMLLPGGGEFAEATVVAQPVIDPELVRVVRPGQSDDAAGLHAMQPLGGSTTGRHFLVPLPPNLPDGSAELFGFFTYEIRVGHRRAVAPQRFWSTAQGRYGPTLVLDGVQHPPPWIDCQIRLIGTHLVVSAEFAQAVSSGKRMTANPPNTELWVVLYAQVHQADGAARRNLLLDRRRAQPGRIGMPHGFTSSTVGLVGWSERDRTNLLEHLGLPHNTPLSVLAVELLPEPNGAFDDPLGGDLGDVRILRTSPLVAVDHVCC